MAVSEQTPIKTHTGNGSTTVFAFDFLVLSASDLEVYLNGALASGYTVSGLGVASGGTVTFSTAPASGVVVSIVGSAAIARSSDLVESGDLLSETLNDEFDRAYVVMRDIAAGGSVGTARSIRVPVGETVPPLASASSRALRLLGFGASGQPALYPLTEAESVAWAAITGRPFVDVVSDYGADATGVADSAAAIQAAINSGAKEVRFPAGTFIVSERLKPASNQAWFGVPGQTTIKVADDAATNTSAVMLNADGAEGSLINFAAFGIIFDGNAKECGFLLYGCDGLTLEDCVFKNGGTYGLALQARPGFSITNDQKNIRLARCDFIDNGSDAPGWDGLDIKWCENAKLVDCHAIGNTDAGINIRGKNVELVGCTGVDNATAGVLLQSNDATEDSYIRVVGGGASGTTAGPGLELQGNASRTTFISVAGFQTYNNAASGVRISGSGSVCGALTGVESRGNTEHGLHITGDYVSDLVVSASQFMANAGNGITTAGKNTVFAAVKSLGNTGFGYRELTGADNNLLLPSCVVVGNTGGDIGTRVGVETDPGFLSVRGRRQIRVFPGESAGFELQADSSGNHASLVAVGDAASVDLRLMTKGNGNITGYKDNGSRVLFEFREAATSTVNYPDFVASLTGNAVQMRASGTDTNIDLALVPKGAGVVSFGSHSALAGETVTGYITIKDAGGTTRKLAVVS